MARKVALGYVSGGAWKESFGRAMVKLALYDRDQRNVIDGVAFNNGIYVDQNRNALVRSFLTSSCEFLFNLDTDIDFEPEVLYRLLDLAEATKAKIVSALYIGRLAMRQNGVETDPMLVPMWFTKKPGELFKSVAGLSTQPQELDGIGMGCCLIHRSVFEAFPDQDKPRPWFACEDWNIAGKWEFIGEDLVFSARARALGFTIVGDSRICVGHDKGQMLTLDLLVKETKEKRPALPVPSFAFKGAA